jgi:hypothetical protein
MNLSFQAGSHLQTCNESELSCICIQPSQPKLILGKVSGNGGGKSKSKTCIGITQFSNTSVYLCLTEQAAGVASQAVTRVDAPTQHLILDTSLWPSVKFLPHVAVLTLDRGWQFAVGFSSSLLVPVAVSCILFCVKINCTMIHPLRSILQDFFDDRNKIIISTVIL